MIGRIAGLTRIEGSENERNQSRYRIQISEYAELKIPEVWKKVTNPVAYRSLKDLRIDLRGLKFQPTPSPRPAAMSGERRMTIADAKEGLALSFGVKPEDVEIIIRG